MAKTTPTLIGILLFSLLIIGKSHTFSRNLGQKELKREKLTHLHFYFHDILSSNHPTAVQVIKAASTTYSTSPIGFGSVVVMDDSLTLGPEPNSKEVGRAQGIYTAAQRIVPGFLMVLNFAFSEGKYNGSSLSVLGRNTVLSAVREMPVIGGSGIFRFSRGYALARTYWSNVTTGNAVVEYNVYVFHY
ncbi:dirigent protein 22-like [Actinidia eriantha]|uniref:dirigent protein 22-like n=1 Tax=Actinidia eriantha TaxID=165200 RepID=UPI0025912635|nr:dirigent protein 22-like [Actinidia eriantha]